MATAVEFSRLVHHGVQVEGDVASTEVSDGILAYPPSR